MLVFIEQMKIQFYKTFTIDKKEFNLHYRTAAGNGVMKKPHWDIDHYQNLNSDLDIFEKCFFLLYNMLQAKSNTKIRLS